MQSENHSNTEYSGKENLEFMKEAYNYNNYIESFLLRFVGNHKVLDFGAASGDYAMRLKNHELCVDCVEIDKDFIKSLESKGFKTYPSLSTVEQKYNRIYTLDVIEHIQDDAQILKDLYNVLSDNGKILIYVPAFNCLYSAMDKQLGHYRRYKKSTLLPLMKQAGFQIETARYVDSIGFFGSLYFKYFGSKNGILNDNKKSITFYYKYIFPISIVLDKILNPFIGKNLLVIAHK